MQHSKEKIEAALAHVSAGGSVYNTSDSGWMETKQFCNWFIQVFVPFSNKIDPIGRKLLFLDGHGSHISFDLIELARSNNVDLFRLPAHTSHIMQPMDLCVFEIYFYIQIYSI